MAANATRLRMRCVTRKAGGLLALVIDCQVMNEGSGMVERHHLCHAPHLLRLVRFRVFFRLARCYASCAPDKLRQELQVI